jgi:hypothetical protein
MQRYPLALIFLPILIALAACQTTPNTPTPQSTHTTTTTTAIIPVDLIKVGIMGRPAEASCDNKLTASVAIEVSNPGGVLIATTVITGNRGVDLIIARDTKQYPSSITPGVSVHTMNIVIPPRIYEEAKDFIAMIEFKLVKNGRTFIARKFYQCSTIVKPTTIPTPQIPNPTQLQNSKDA